MYSSTFVLDTRDNALELLSLYYFTETRGLTNAEVWGLAIYSCNCDFIVFKVCTIHLEFDRIGFELQKG